MKWKKKGKLFDPTNHGLNFECTDYAQSPQTIVFKEHVRIYFSTRKKDQTGKFLSEIAFVDLDKELKEIINFSKNEVIPLGKLGCFDEHGIFPINPLLHNGQIMAYTCGWNRRVSVSVDTSTGLAISDDNGDTFKKIGDGPVLSSSLKEPMLVGDSFVKVFDGVFHMWYIFGKNWIEAQNEEPPARVYKIAHATSNDGVTWEKKDGVEIIGNVIDENECQALPTVIKHNGYYHMYFCFRHATDFRKNPERGYRIGYAYSHDLVNWIRDDSTGGIEKSESGWDSEMMCYPHIFTVEDEIYMLYNGNEFGKYGFGLAQLIDT
ncbi:MAG: hypothetical protein RIF36_27425 [Imperialibacter sp.]|uniref:hypothetical protein n=1 Tax=Imperialibacter sp. TaxID=2038411 RepID=UPI0032EE8482